MLQPHELKLDLPVSLASGAISNTTKLWQVLHGAHLGNLEQIKHLVEECPQLAFAQYNYTPPIHFAVREGHIKLVEYLLSEGAHDPAYKTYPFLDSLETIADERGHKKISSLLKQYALDLSLHKYKGDNGEIHFNRTENDLEFQKAVNKGDYDKTERLLKDNPSLALDETFFWGEGILLMPAKSGNFKLIKLLMDYGARVPGILKWTQAYYFERYENAVFLIENGMNPNTMSWHHVTILHDMAQKGDIQKAGLLIDHGADIDPVEEEYQSTPLGLAARWGQTKMVKFLLQHGADPNKSGASWSTPLEWARKKGFTEIESLLKKSGAK